MDSNQGSEKEHEQLIPRGSQVQGGGRKTRKEAKKLRKGGKRGRGAKQRIHKQNRNQNGRKARHPSLAQLGASARQPPQYKKNSSRKKGRLKKRHGRGRNESKCREEETQKKALEDVSQVLGESKLSKIQGGEAG